MKVNLNLLDVVGVKEGEEFEFCEACRCVYKVESNFLYVESSVGEWVKSDIKLNKMLEYTIKRFPFKPKYGDEYWYVEVKGDDCVDCTKWFGTDVDKNIKKYSGCYRTKEEALERAKELGLIS